MYVQIKKDGWIHTFASSDVVAFFSQNNSKTVVVKRTLSTSVNKYIVMDNVMPGDIVLEEETEDSKIDEMYKLLKEYAHSDDCFITLTDLAKQCLSDSFQQDHPHNA